MANRRLFIAVLAGKITQISRLWRTSNDSLTEVQLTRDPFIALFACSVSEPAGTNATSSSNIACKLSLHHVLKKVPGSSDIETGRHMKTSFLFVIALSLVLDSCGGGLELTMKPSKGFKVKSSVEVESNGFDPLSLRSKIARALFKNGINVESPLFTAAGSPRQQDLVSQAAAPTTVGKSDSVAAGSSTVNGRGQSPLYFLEFTYKSDYTFSGGVITDFSATILKAGEIVGEIGYHGGRITPEQLAENVGKELAQKLK